MNIFKTQKTCLFFSIIIRRYPMETEGITKEMVYLCIGDELNNLNTTEISVEYFEGIKYYLIGGFSLIRGESLIHCSCNQNYCWHIFKLILDGNDL